jgi:hypothetical protein
MFKYFPAVTLFLAACSTGALTQNRDKALESSTQQEGTTVSCSGYKAWPDCFKAAERSCPKGYGIVNQEENIITQSRTLRINCK